MSLENIVQVLELAINGRIEELDEKLLRERNVQETLTTFFAEQQVRPELVSQIRAHSLMYDYLQLSLEEREELASFNKSFPYFFKGDKDEIRIDGKLVEKIGNFVKKCRYTEQLLQIFEYYLTNRKSGEIFNSNYLVDNRKMNIDLNGMGRKLEERISRIFRDNGKFKAIVGLASEINPEIKQYTERQEVLKIDGVQQLIRIFEFYLSHKKDGQVFNTHYLTKDEEMNKALSHRGKNLYSLIMRNLENGFEDLLILASKERPELLSYTSRENVFTAECIQDLAQLFDFFMKYRKEGEVFNTSYLVNDVTLKKIHGTRGSNLYRRAQNNFRNEGGINYLIQLVSQQRPEILQFWSYDEKKSVRKKK